MEQSFVKWVPGLNMFLWISWVLETFAEKGLGGQNADGSTAAIKY